MKNEKWFVDEESDGQLWIVSNEDETIPIMKICHKEIQIGTNSYKLEVTDKETVIAKLSSKAPEMHEALKDVHTDITIVGEVSRATLEKIKSILKELKS